MPQAFFNDLEVGAAGPEPGCVGAAEVVDADLGIQVGLVEGGLPDPVAEPVGGMRLSVSRRQGSQGLSLPSARRRARYSAKARLQWSQRHLAAL